MSDALNPREILGPFQQLKDPRSSNAVRHVFEEVLIIALAATLAGAEAFTDMERFGKDKIAFFQSFLSLPNGIPSHDAFGDLFALLDPEHFNACFLEWTAPFRQNFPDEVVAFDGKSLRGSHDRSRGKPIVHTVNAWACRNRIALGQLAVDAKSNEITAIPKLMNLLMLEGCIVTIDAMGTQKSIARQIISQKADYILALKDNHPTFHNQVKELFACPETLKQMVAQGAKFDHFKDHEKAHGRQETRECTVLEKVDWYRGHCHWEGLRSLVMIESTRQEGSKPATTERRFYLTSLGADAAKILTSIRCHWAIENSLHWVLDVVWREDQCRARCGNSAEILSLLRKMALNRLQQSPRKDSIRGKQRSAGWSNSYLLDLLKI